MSEPRTGPWTKEEHAETRARLDRVDSGEEDGIDVDDYDTLLEEAIWMGSEALPRALAEIERLQISSDAGWAIAKARLELLDKLNAEIAKLSPAKVDHRGAAMVAELYGGAGEVAGLRARHAKAQAEADDLAKALREHPDAKPEDKPETRLAKLRRETFERIAALPVGKRHKAAARASRSFSVPKSCIEREGCRVEGAVMVWPDGERYPTQPGFGGVEQMRVAFDAFDAAISTAQGAYHNHEQWGPEQWDPITQARTDFYQAYESIPKP